MQLTLHLNRDSVHAGDDLESHVALIQVEANSTIADLLVRLKSEYLPSISGGQATWIISSSGNVPIPVGVLAQQWRQPKLRVPLGARLSELFGTTKPSISFEYCCQKDPDLAFDRIAAGKEPLAKW
jgi:hypothetical protein